MKDFLFLITKKRESRNYEDCKPVETDKEFIDHNTFEEDVNFYRTIDCKKSRFDCTQVGKLILELDDSDDDDDLPKACKHIYGTDNYEW